MSQWKLSSSTQYSSNHLFNIPIINTLILVKSQIRPKLMSHTKSKNTVIVHSPRLTPFWQTKTLECGWFTNSGFGLTMLIVLYYSEASGDAFFCLEPISFQKKSTAEETKTTLTCTNVGYAPGINGCGGAFRKTRGLDVTSDLGGRSDQSPS